MDSLFEALFKYRPLLFERGEIAFSTPWPAGLLLAAGAALAAAAILTYLRPRADARPLDRGVMAALRLLALAVVLLCLLQPTLVLRSTVPQRNFVGVLMDGSQSMEIRDADGESRRGFVDRELLGEDAPLLSSLSERFAVRHFRFGDEASRLSDPSSMNYDASTSRLAPGLDLVRQELDGVPLSGIVVVSDGGSPGDDELEEALLRLRGSGIPVYAVGVGSERIRPDVQVSRVEMPRRILRGSAVAVDVVLASAGLEGRTVPLTVEEEGVPVEERAVTLPGDGEPAVVRLQLRAEEPGPRLFRFSVPEQAGEPVVRNNVREVLVSVEERTEKILYVEGRPRFEAKFLRRAVAGDDLLQVVLLQRTAEDKFLRLDVDDPGELAAGFPRSREELFRYRALVLGSVEAGFFTADQLRMVGDFVARRGGTLLVLGGPDSYAQGGFEGTPVADALPVRLGGTRPLGGEGFLADVRVEPTPAGRGHAALQLGAADEADPGSGDAWSRLPPLTTVNPIREIKPGASALLVGRSPGLDGDLLVLASQRYGRGRALALTVQDTWIWQMHAEMGVEDLTHETFWRQLLRWTVAGVPDPVELRTLATPVEPGRAVELAAEVSDSAFLRVNDARVRALVTGPGGEEREVVLRWDGEEDGVYRGSFVPGAGGVHRVQVEARSGEGAVGADAVAFQAGPSQREHFDAGMNAGLLRRVAEATGGRFYTPATASRLAEDLTYTGAGITVTEERDLWDMPALFLLLIVLVGAEWGFRRARGLA